MEPTDSSNSACLNAVHLLHRLGADSACDAHRGPQRVGCADRSVGVCVSESYADGVDAGGRGVLGPQGWVAACVWVEMTGACVRTTAHEAASALERPGQACRMATIIYSWLVVKNGFTRKWVLVAQG